VAQAPSPVLIKLPFIIQPLVIFRLVHQPGPHRIIDNVIHLYQILIIVSDYPVITLVQLYIAFSMKGLINFLGRITFYAVHDFEQD
jgi:hypothetical protein